jgi:hypothetical protein
MKKQDIDQKYLDLASALEAEFFDIIDLALPSQHRVLKLGKTLDDFNQRHGEIWRSHEKELIEGGFIEAVSLPPPVNWQAEWDKALPEDKTKVLARMMGINP